MKLVVLKLIRLYQIVISAGILKIFLGGSCRFIPTCSEYTYLVVKRYGTIKGLYLGLLRITHCHPFSKGGRDLIKLDGR